MIIGFLAYDIKQFITKFLYKSTPNQKGLKNHLMSRQASTGFVCLTFGGLLRRTYFFTNPGQNLTLSSQFEYKKKAEKLLAYRPFFRFKPLERVSQTHSVSWAILTCEQELTLITTVTLLCFIVQVHTIKEQS
jgi:hypothetical protein